MRSAIVTILCHLAFFANTQNNLRLFTSDGSIFTAYLNDSLLNKTPQASVFAEHIKQDTVKITIEFENSLRGEQQLYLMEKGKPVAHKEFNYVIEINDNKIKFSYSGTHTVIKLPEPLVPDKPVIDTSTKYNNNVLGHYVELKNGKPQYFNNLPSKGECATPMPEAYMNYLNILMSKAQVDEAKFNIAEYTARNNCVSVSQFNRILSYIPYEIEKLKLIKLSFTHLTDKHNKQKLDSTLKLESSKRELMSFLKNAESEQTLISATCGVAAEESEFKQFCSQLSVYSNDTERYYAMKKNYSDNCYSVSQIKSVLALFIHDREKTDAAKLLYFYCVDREKFLDIADVFSYNTSVAEIKEFVSKQKN